MSFFNYTLSFFSFLFFFLSIWVFFIDTDNSQDSRGREGTIFYSTLPLPPAHEHWDIYLQLCIWDEYRVLLIATLVFTRLLLEEVYHLIELPFEWLIDDAMFVCLLDKLILDFCYSDLTLETGGLELASTYHTWFDFYLIRRDLALETFRNKFSYLNHFIITSKYKFLYW